jgi:hypothetical protein
MPAVYGAKYGRFIDNDVHPMDPARCGTAANVRAHQRRGQKLCRRCRVFEAARVNEYEERRPKRDRRKR